MVDDGNTAPYRLLCPARVARPHRAALHWDRSWRGVRRGWDHPNRDLPRPPPPRMSRRAEPSPPTPRPGRKQLNATRIRRPTGAPARVPIDDANAWGERVAAGPRSPFQRVHVLSGQSRSHRPANGRYRRISPVAECPDQGPLTEPAADARPWGWGLLFLPQSGHCAS